MNYLLACRACLVTGVKMYQLDILANSYWELTGVHAPTEPPDAICYECAAFLLKFKKFRDKCLRANILLSTFKTEDEKVTKHFIENVDRKEHNLESTISISKLTETNVIYKTESDYIELNLNELTADVKEVQTDVKIETNAAADIILEYERDNDIKPLCVEILNNGDEESVAEFKGETNANDSSSDDDYLLKDYVLMKQKKKSVPIKEKKKRGRPRKVLKESAVQDSVENIAVENSINSNEVKPKRLKHNTEDSTATVKAKKVGSKFDSSFFEDYGTVVQLTPEAAKQEVLLRKESSNYKNCLFKCELCYRGFEARTTYENHMKKHSPEFGEHDCEFCHLKFHEQSFLYKHIIACHKRKFYCKICPYTCFCTYQAKTHISLHKGKKYPCKECGETFNMPNSLLMHKRVKHPAECVCAICGGSFVTERGLRAHAYLLHRLENNEEKGPRCEECNIHFATETAWKRHLVLSSKHTVSHGCESCGETFESEERLRKHARLHARKQGSRADVKLPAACELCEKWMVTRTEYREHMQSAHPQAEATRRMHARDRTQCVCEVCGKVFKKPCFLVYHQRAHTGERPYKCGQCGKAYAFPGALSTHRSTHGAQRRHKCHLCGKLYTFRSALNKHLKAHLGIRPHKCKICEKSFPNPCDVKLHMQYVHYKVPWPKRDRAKRTKLPPAEPAQTAFIYPTLAS